MVKGGEKMAIGSYYDVYTVEEYEKRVNNIATSIIELGNGNFFFQAKRKVLTQINILKIKEQKIFKLLNVNNLKELNQRLEKYKTDVCNLSGAGLNEAFLESLRWKSEKEFRTFEEAVMSVIEEEILEGKPIYEWGVDTARKKVLEAISESFGNIPNVKFWSEKGMSSTEFSVANFTKEQKERWKKLLATKYKNNLKAQRYNIIVNSTETSFTNEFNWYGITNKLTQLEAKEQLTLKEVYEINQKIKALILSKVSDQGLISQILDHILMKDPYAFFVGKNLNDITGLLGEVQGLYYLAKFLGDDLSAALSWQGGLHVGSGNKKPHQDILLNGLGIQVKNSAKDDFFGNDISFANASIQTILDKLNITSEAKNLFANFYATLNFNIEYHYEKEKSIGTQYVKGIRMTDKGAEQFVQLHTKLESYQNDIDKLMSLFAATLMYMDADVLAQGMDANVLYLLGGVAFQTASNILSMVLKELEAQERSFQMKASFKTDKNIITALNSGARGQNYSNFVLNDIQLTSTFRF